MIFPKAFLRAFQSTLAILVIASGAIFLTVDHADSVGEMGPTATYNGGEIPTDRAAEMGLDCLQRANGKLVCFDSAEELESSRAAAAERKAAGTYAKSATKRSSKRSSKRRKTSRTASSITYMWLTQHKDFTGWSIKGYARQNWYNLTGSYNDAVSAADAGNHSGYLAKNYNGGGARLHFYQYQEVWNFALEAPSYNDQISSRYRN